MANAAKFLTVETFKTKTRDEQIRHLLVTLENGVVGISIQALIPYYIERSRILLAALIEDRRLTKKVVDDSELEDDEEETGEDYENNDL